MRLFTISLSRQFAKRYVAPSVLLGIAACAAQPPRNPGSAAPASASKGAVATETHMASEAALATLRAGGHAVDAAITAALVAGVVAPQSSGIGGGGFALVWDAKQKKASFFDFREHAPAGFDAKAWETPDALPAGAKVGVPGEVAGLWELHKRWGRRPFTSDAEAAVRYARDGYMPERHLVRVLDKIFPPPTPPVHRRFADYTTQNPKQPIQNPGLAQTLAAVAHRGASAFYEGGVAACMAEAARAQGGALTVQDLQAYRVIERPPLQTKWEGLDVVTIPPPSGGGLTLLETLGSYSRAELAALDLTSAEGVHSLAENFRGVLADRFRGVGDPSQQPFDEATWLNPARLRARRAAYQPDATRSVASFVTADHGTSHLVTADGDGNIVSLTTSVNTAFGAKFYAEPCGVLLNDTLTDFTSRTTLAKAGVTHSPGSPRPGARPPSSMTPTVVLSDGKPVLSLGGSGGMRIATAVTQVVVRVLAQGASLDEAIRRPRLHVTPDGELLVEPGLLTPASIQDLQRRGERVREDGSIWSLSGVQAVAFGNASAAPIRAMADPRKFGEGMLDSGAPEPRHP